MWKAVITYGFRIPGFGEDKNYYHFRLPDLIEICRKDYPGNSKLHHGLTEHHLFPSDSELQRVKPAFQVFSRKTAACALFCDPGPAGQAKSKMLLTVNDW